MFQIYELTQNLFVILQLSKTAIDTSLVLFWRNQNDLLAVRLNQILHLQREDDGDKFWCQSDEFSGTKIGKEMERDG